MDDLIECDYHLQGRCFHPKRVPEHLLTIGCDRCQEHRVDSTIVLFKRRRLL